MFTYAIILLEEFENKINSKWIYKLSFKLNFTDGIRIEFCQAVMFLQNSYTKQIDWCMNYDQYATHAHISQFPGDMKQVYSSTCYVLESLLRLSY